LTSLMNLESPPCGHRTNAVPVVRHDDHPKQSRSCLRNAGREQHLELAVVTVVEKNRHGFACCLGRTRGKSHLQTHVSCTSVPCVHSRGNKWASRPC
jgi:hypothetical protein